MKVILKETVSKLGSPGDVVSFSEGYARNFLFPQRKAMPATKAELANIDQHRKILQKRQEKLKAQAEALAQKLTEAPCIVQKKGGLNNKLFGSVTSQDIFAALMKQGFRLDKRSIDLKSPIKETGDFTVTVRLHPEVKIDLKVTVKGNV